MKTYVFPYGFDDTFYSYYTSVVFLIGLCLMTTGRQWFPVRYLKNKIHKPSMEQSSLSMKANEMPCTHCKVPIVIRLDLKSCCALFNPHQNTNEIQLLNLGNSLQLIGKNLPYPWKDFFIWNSRLVRSGSTLKKKCTTLLL